MLTVKLTRDEMIFAALGGVVRNIDAILQDRRSIFGNPQRELWANNMIGALAECAVAKVGDRYWTPLYDQPTGVVDVGRRLQVRSSINPDAKLRAYERDDPELAFILVIVRAPEFDLVGWLWGREIKQDCWRQGANGSEACWGVPQSALREVAHPPARSRSGAGA
jgi:hypothetical protein